MQIIRHATDRGHANHGWLDSWHSFSFADYYDARHMHFGALRVINDDRIAAGSGFGMHPHRDMEIITYMLAGELQHRDSMGNGSTIRAGEIQRMSAGTGIMHSEANASKTDAVHLFQIWIFPEQKNLSPGYEQIAIDPANKRGKLHLVAAREGGTQTVVIHADARLLAGCFDGEEKQTLPLDATRRYYLQVARGSISAGNHVLHAGDALMLTEEKILTLDNGHDAEVLLFDLA